MRRRPASRNAAQRKSLASSRRLVWFASAASIMFFILAPQSLCADKGKELRNAAEKGDVQRVVALLDQGIDPDSMGEFRSTPLLFAAEKGRSEIVSVLLKRGARPNIASSTGTTPLCAAAGNGHLETVKVLIDSGATTNGKCSQGYTLLMEVASHGHAPVLKFLIQRGLDVNEMIETGFTALGAAASKGHIEAATILLESGADPNKGIAGTLTPLMYASIGGFADMAKLLILRGAKTDATFRAGTALSIAVRDGHLDIAKVLVEAGADPYPLFSSSDWEKAEQENSTVVYQKIIETSPFSILKSEAKKRIENPEYAFIQTCRIGTKKALQGFIQSHPDSDRIPMASAYLEYMKQEDLNSIASAQAFVKNFPTHPFAEFVKARFPALYLKEQGAKPALREITLVGIGDDEVEERQKGIWNEVNNQLQAAGFDQIPIDLTVGRVLEKGISHFIEVEFSRQVIHGQAQAGAGQTQTPTGMAGLDRQMDRVIAPGYFSNSPMNADPIVRSMQREALNRVTADAAMGLAGLIMGSGGNRPKSQVREKTLISVKDASGIDLYAQYPSLSVSIGRANFVQLLKNSPREAKSAYSIFALGSASIGDELHTVSTIGDIELAGAILRTGADPNAFDRRGFTPLGRAASADAADMIGFLAKSGADINLKDRFGFAPLLRAAESGSQNALNSLLQLAADINTRSNAGENALLVALRNTRKDIARFLIEKGIDLKVRSITGLTPMLSAVAMKDPDFAEYLARLDLDVNQGDVRGKTPLMEAAGLGELTTTRMLLQRGAKVDASDEDGNTAFHYAARNGRAGVIEALLDVRADRLARNRKGETPLVLSAREGSLEAFNLLIKGVTEPSTEVIDAAKTGGKYAVLGVLDPFGYNELHAAASRGDQVAVTKLLADAASINETTKAMGNTPLHIAAAQGHLEVCRSLLSAGAKSTAVDVRGNTPLHVAAENGESQIAEMLVQASASVYARNKAGETPLMVARRIGLSTSPGESNSTRKALLDLLRSKTQGTVFLYRRKEGGRPSIFIDGKEIIRLAGKHYFAISLDPGQRRISSDNVNSPGIQLVIEPTKTYYIRAAAGDQLVIENEANFQSDQAKVGLKPLRLAWDPPPDPKAEPAKIYFFKTDAGGAPSVFIDEMEVARIEPNSFFIVKVPAGNHCLFADDFGTKETCADFESGKTYYVREKLTFKSGEILEIQSEADFKEKEKELKPLPSKWRRDYTAVLRIF